MPQYGINHHSAKSTEADIRMIRELADEGASQVSIAKIFSMHPGNIWKIVHRVTWKCVE